MKSQKNARNKSGFSKRRKHAKSRLFHSLDSIKVNEQKDFIKHLERALKDRERRNVVVYNAIDEVARTFIIDTIVLSGIRNSLRDIYERNYKGGGNADFYKRYLNARDAIEESIKCVSGLVGIRIAGKYLEK